MTVHSFGFVTRRSRLAKRSPRRTWADEFTVTIIVDVVIGLRGSLIGCTGRSAYSVLAGNFLAFPWRIADNGAG